MSSDYYFLKWNETLKRLDEIIQLDQGLQNTKAHDKKRCEAVMRLCGVLGEYIAVYNEAMECYQQNLQVQKTEYMFEVVRAITNRLLELKHSIRKLECSDTQFLGRGLADRKLTTYDAELDDVPTHVERPEHLNAAVAEAFRKAEERRELERIAEETEKYNAENCVLEPMQNWWEDEDEPREMSTQMEEEDKPETEEMMQMRVMTSLIQAHERSRQIIRWAKHRKQLREMWHKELTGTLKPSAPLELQERSAKLIQKVCRAFFELKRKKIRDCKLDEALGMRLCGKANQDAINRSHEIKQIRVGQRKEFKQQWMESRMKLKEHFTKLIGGEVADDCRDLIREWFKKWFDDVKYFQNIPKEAEGGSTLILKEEIPDPIEWWETYQTYLEQKKANKNKSALQLKKEKFDGQRQEMMTRKEAQIKKKLEAEMMKKIMKNPTLHPGFNYPESKRIGQISMAIEQYRRDWEFLDHCGTNDVKKKFVPSVDINDVYAETKKELMQTVDEHMRMEHKILKKALKKDYANNGEKYPEPLKKRRKRVQKKKVKGKISENISEKLEDLAFKGILKQYPQTAIANFSGDHNFAGDDMRCKYEPALHFSGETRSFWWERCREATHGFHKILIVGPYLSGKTILVHALASVTGAVLFELDLTNLCNLSSSSKDIQKLMDSVVTCARAAQPAVIHVKHIHRLFYKKIPPEEGNLNLDLMKGALKKMLKKFSKTDRVSVIGSCVNPWLTKSSQLIKLFPAIVVIPNTSYSAVIRLLTQWVGDNRYFPRDLDVHSLAHVLQGYSYGFLKQTLKDFLTPEVIIRIAARGLSPTEVYNYFLEKEAEKVVSGRVLLHATLQSKAAAWLAEDAGSNPPRDLDYAKYQKWYTEKTPWGKKESKHIQEQQAFKSALETFAKRMEKQAKMVTAARSATALHRE